MACEQDLLYDDAVHFANASQAAQLVEVCGAESQLKLSLIHTLYLLYIVDIWIYIYEHMSHIYGYLVHVYDHIHI